MAAEDPKIAEPEEEITSEEKATPTPDSSLSATQTTIATEATEGEEEEDPEAGNKYVLLDRLFKFVRTKEELNPVLSGYFSKLVSLLISRKQKLLIPYIYSPDRDIIECMLDHVYQKSISEVLNKLLVQFDSEYEPEIQTMIKVKQQTAVAKLVDKLGPSFTEEDNMNASTILQDLIEKKEFFTMICKRELMAKIVDYSTALISESSV